MAFDNDLIAGKLRRWEKYLQDYSLPVWKELPDLGLYMEQVMALLKTYLDYLPPELKGDEVITSASINNYVRTGIMPKPEKKKYYRKHIAYLVMICTLKESLSMSMIRCFIPQDFDDTEALETFYDSYVRRHRQTVLYFASEVRKTAGKILKHKDTSPIACESTEDMITSTAVVSGFASLFAEKLLLLSGHTLDDGDDIRIVERRR